MSLYHDTEEEKLLYDNLDKICTERRILELEIVEPTKEEKERINYVIMKFIKDNERIIYGGQAYHTLIRNVSDDYIYTDLDYPDVEFYTPNLKEDIINLCNILKESGFNEVMAEEGVHPTTFRLNVNLETFCDISYYPQRFFNSIGYTTINDYKYAEVPFMFIDVLKIYCYPINNYFRLTKTFKRANLLLKYYPILYNKYPATEIINKYTSTDFLTKTCIITDVAAHNVYLEAINCTISKSTPPARD